MVMLMTMIMVNIHEAKAKLSEYLEAVARGEQVVICNHNRPVAELRAIPAQAATTPRPIGLAKGQVVIPASFFDPLPDDLLDAFEGKSSARPASRVAERPPTYDAPRRPKKRRR